MNPLASAAAPTCRSLERNDEGDGDEERRPAATSSGGVEKGADKEGGGDDEGGTDKGANDEGINDEGGDEAGGTAEY